MNPEETDINFARMGDGNGGKTPCLSIVIPMYNEAQNIDALFKRLFPVLEKLGETFEVVCVNDGSTDRTLSMLLSHQKHVNGLVVVDLARNFGQHAAVMAGFSHSRGRWIITMDADLQNPPEEIPAIMECFINGNDLVGTVRQARQDSAFRKWSSRITNRIITRISGINLKDFGCMLRGYSREVVDGILANPEYRTFIPALATFFAHDPVEIPVRHEDRAAGDSKYSLLKLFSLQLDLMTGFSMWPLRILFFVGTGLAITGVVLAVALVVLRIILGPGWAAQGVFTLFAALFFFVGGQFFALGLLGEYVGRIFQAVRRRPTFLVGKVYM